MSGAEQRSRGTASCCRRGSMVTVRRRVRLAPTATRPKSRTGGEKESRIGVSTLHSRITAGVVLVGTSIQTYLVSGPEGSNAVSIVTRRVISCPGATVVVLLDCGALSRALVQPQEVRIFARVTGDLPSLRNTTVFSTRAVRNGSTRPKSHRPSVGRIR